MSLLTRCPACTTLYRVVPDQLRISEGWVKCGQCGDIFDASKHLIEAECEPEPQQHQDVGLSPTVEPPVSVDADDPPTWDVPRVAFESDPIPETSLEAQAGGSASLDTTESPELNADTTQKLQTQENEPNGMAEGALNPEVTPNPEPMLRVRWDDDVLMKDPTQGHSDDGTQDHAKVSFLRSDRAQAFWRKPLVRSVLLLVTLLLGLTLLMQWIYLDRDRLTAQQPDLKPILQTFCEFAQCKIDSLKRIESLSVDSVGFNELGRDGYRLSFSVKNANGLPLAFPSVELTLTDERDQPVFRRVFSSHELGAEDSEIAAGAEWPVVVTLRVNSEATAARVLGYRLLVFYP